MNEVRHNPMRESNDVCARGGVNTGCKLHLDAQVTPELRTSCSNMHTCIYTHTLGPTLQTLLPPGTLGIGYWWDKCITCLSPEAPHLPLGSDPVDLPSVKSIWVLCTSSAAFSLLWHCSLCLHGFPGLSPQLCLPPAQ